MIIYTTNRYTKVHRRNEWARMLIYSPLTALKSMCIFLLFLQFMCNSSYRIGIIISTNALIVTNETRKSNPMKNTQSTNQQREILPQIDTKLSRHFHRKNIVNGDSAIKYRYPYAVTLQLGGYHICGASLIAPDILLSAAHCYFDGNDPPAPLPRLPLAIVGDYHLNDNFDGGERFSVKSVVLHPDYKRDKGAIINDVMILKLDGIVSSESKTPVRLNSNKNVPERRGDVLGAIGWGAVDRDGTIMATVLQEVDLHYIENDECVNRGITGIQDNMICAIDLDGGDDNDGEGETNGIVDEDVCVGDSGGPLIIKGGDNGAQLEGQQAEDIQVGIISFGHQLCAHPTYPGVYTRISAVYDWIREQVCDLSANPLEYFNCSDNVDIQSSVPSIIPTLSASKRDLPCHSSCYVAKKVPWHNNGNDLTSKCSWKRYCVGCPECNEENSHGHHDSNPPTISPTDSPSSYPCKSWCNNVNEIPWHDDREGKRSKCDWKPHCAGCSACQLNIHSHVPTNAPMNSFTMNPSQINKPPFHAEPCLYWCRNDKNTLWYNPHGKAKCKMKKICGGCSECQQNHSTAPLMSHTPSISSVTPSHSCQPWCLTSNDPWHDNSNGNAKCNIIDACGGCSKCQVNIHSHAPSNIASTSPSQSIKSPYPEYLCHDWCRENRTIPWHNIHGKDKCKMKKICGGCSECQQNHTTESPSSHIVSTSPVTLSYSCKSWCKNSKKIRWHDSPNGNAKCNMINSCGGCPECHIKEIPCESWCAANDEQWFGHINAKCYWKKTCAGCPQCSARKLQNVKKNITESIQNHRKNIVGGTNASKDRYSYAVSLQYFNQHICGASLIAPDIVMSAAHCFSSGIYPTAIVGDFHLNDNEDGGEPFSIKHAIRHPEYVKNELALVNDVLLFQLESSISSERKMPVRLNSDPNVPSSRGDTVGVIGWGAVDRQGQTMSMVLKEADLGYIDNNECYQMGVKGLENNMLCTHDLDGLVDEDACFGDSGGPLIVKGNDEDLQVGITSFGPTLCAHPKYPAVYTRVSAVYEWIREHVCQTSVEPPQYFGCNETKTPTISPAPFPPPLTSVPTTAEVWVSFGILFDAWPQDFAWRVLDEDKKEVKFKIFGAYPNEIYSEKFVLEKLPLKFGKRYELRVYDNHNDGICCDYGEGRYFLHWGLPGEEGFKEDSLLLWSNGKYNRKKTHFFDTKKPANTSPTPSSSHSLKGTYITIQIHFDMFPNHVGWQVDDGEAIYGKKSPGSYIVSMNQTITEFVSISPGIEVLNFTLEDITGDGFCCEGGQGYYKVYEGPVSDNNILLNGNGEIGRRLVQLLYLQNVLGTGNPSSHPSTLYEPSDIPTLHPSEVEFPSSVPSKQPSFSLLSPSDVPTLSALSNSPRTNSTQPAQGHQTEPPSDITSTSPSRMKVTPPTSGTSLSPSQISRKPSTAPSISSISADEYPGSRPSSSPMPSDLQSESAKPSTRKTAPPSQERSNGPRRTPPSIAPSDLSNEAPTNANSLVPSQLISENSHFPQTSPTIASQSNTQQSTLETTLLPTMKSIFTRTIAPSATSSPPVTSSPSVTSSLSATSSPSVTSSTSTTSSPSATSSTSITSSPSATSSPSTSSPSIRSSPSATSTPNDVKNTRNTTNSDQLFQFGKAGANKSSTTYNHLCNPLILITTVFSFLWI